MEEQIKQIMSDILDIDPESIDQATTQDNTLTWDSLNHINVIVAIEQEFEISFEPYEIEQMVSFIEIVETLENKLRLRTQ